MAELSISDSVLRSEINMGRQLSEIDFGPKVHYVYNPIEYAQELHQNYLSLACSGKKCILFLGMNPGPWGMMQNGVPFGESSSVRGFLNLSGNVSKPGREHPKRPVLGLECKRSEVSGKRFWSLASILGNGSAQEFFTNCAVHNYFPLCLLNEQGKNVTPPELKPPVQREIEKICDQSLVEVLNLLQIEIIIAIGRFAEKRALKIVDQYKLLIGVKYIPHPSPRNPESNKDWVSATQDLILNKFKLKEFFT